MQTKSLEIFLMVVKLGSFSEAAKQLFTVQSNVTNHIKKLEAELNVQLLYRQTPIQPTRAGLQLYGYAEQMISLKKDILNTFICNEIDRNIALEIGSMETTLAVRLPKLFQYIQQQDKKFLFQLSTNPTRDLIDKVKKSELDCAFIANNKPIEGLFNLHVWSEKLVLISPRTAPDQLLAEFYIDKKFIAFRQGCSYRKSIDLFLDYYQLPAVNILEMGSLEGIISCVSLGMGLALLPASYIQKSPYLNEIKVHEIPDSIAHIKTYLIADLPNTWGTNMHTFIQYVENFRAEGVAENCEIS